MAFDPRRITSRYFDEDNEEEKTILPRGISIDKLLQTFHESSELYQPPLESYGLRHDLFRDWVDRHPTERLRYWAQQLYENTRYVSHNEFFSKYDLIAEELLYQTEGVKVDVYLYLGITDIRKSNFWIMLYLLSRMHRVVTKVITLDDIRSEIVINEEGEEEDRITFPYQKNSLIIIPDDAIYSGNQMHSQIRELCSNILPYWIEDPSEHRVQIVVASAFISAKARRKLVHPTVEVHFPIYSDTFDVLELPSDLYLDQSRAPSLHTIYFDHKLADMLSVYQTVYALGVGLGDRRDKFPYYPVSLIANCNPPEMIQEKYGTVDYFLNKAFNGVDIHKAIEICPFSPYKRKRYTFQGKPLCNIEELV